jgi:hypothetical protein
MGEACSKGNECSQVTPTRLAPKMISSFLSFMGDASLSNGAAAVREICEELRNRLFIGFHIQAQEAGRPGQGLSRTRFCLLDQNPIAILNEI